jgi:hypothetical protein
MRKPKLPKKPKAPKASASLQSWKNYSAKLDAWRKACAAKLKPYNEFKKVREQARAKAMKV